MDDKQAVLQTTVPGAVRRFWWLSLAIVVLVGLAGALWAVAQGPTTSATTSIVVEDPRNSSLFSNGSPSDAYVLDQAVILKLPVTVDLAAADLRAQGLADLDTEEFLDGLSIENDGETNLLQITFTSADPAVPVPAVNALVRRYREVLVEQAGRAVREQLATVEAAITRLDTEAAALPETASVALLDLQRARADLVQQRTQLQLGQNGVDGIRVVSPATRAETDDGLSVPVGLALGLAVGCVPAATAAYLLAQRRRRFGHRYQPEAVLGRPLLAEVPDFYAEKLTSDLPVVDDPTSSGAESFRFLSSAVAVQQRSSRLRTVAVVSAASRDGKTTVAANLAVTAAQDGQRVLAIDADLSGQGLGFLLVGNDRTGPGLVQVLDGSARFENVVRRTDLGSVSLDVLTGGSDERFVTELFASSRARELISSLGERYDLVVLDVPPLLQVAYSQALLGHVDATVLVVPHGAAVASVEEVGERVAYLDAAVAGYVYNRAPLRREVGRHSKMVGDLKPHAERPPTEIRRLADLQALPLDERAKALRV